MKSAFTDYHTRWKLVNF